MAYTLVNSSGANIYGAGTTRNDFYSAAGSAVSTSVPTGFKVVGGTVFRAASANAGTKAAVNGLSSSAVALNVFGGTRAYRGFINGVTSPIVSGAHALGTFGGSINANSGGCAFSTTAAHNFIAGTLVYIGPSGTGSVAIAPGSGKNAIYGVHTVTGAGSTTFATSFPYFAMASGAQVTIQALNTSTTYPFAKTTNTIVGTKITSALKGPAGPVNTIRSIHKRESYRTSKLTTALRAGSYNRYLGKWTSTVSLQNDYSTFSTWMATDDAAAPTVSTPGELVIKEPKPIPALKDYSAKTTW